MGEFEAGAQMSDRPNLDKLVDACDYDTKVAITAWVFKHVLAHAKERGSFRGLIYERLGFGPDTYADFCQSGGLEISNEFDIARNRKVLQVVQEQKIEALKEVLSLCDEPECFKEATAGFPSEAGYRRTCNEHSTIVIGKRP